MEEAQCTSCDRKTDPSGFTDKDLAAEIVKQLEIQGKRVAVPEAFQEKPGVTGELIPDDRSTKKAKPADGTETTKKPEPS